MFLWGVAANAIVRAELWVVLHCAQPNRCQVRQSDIDELLFIKFVEPSEKAVKRIDGVDDLKKLRKFGDVHLRDLTPMFLWGI
jgi:hypothetical protein